MTTTLKQPSVEPQSNTTFKLDDAFVEQYRTKDPGFGFNGLGLFTYKRTYAREVDGRKEEWFETIRRVVEGMYSIQKRHIMGSHLGWDDAKGQQSAQECYDRMFNMKFLPPGRGLWMMGTEFVEKRGGAALNNCAFISTQGIKDEFSQPFRFMMDASMVGVGVGFDTNGAGSLTIRKPGPHTFTYQIPDSREGWVASLGLLLESYATDNNYEAVQFDYSLVRPAGEPIRGFGGVASGPEPLRVMHEAIRKVLDDLDGKPITKTAIVDIMNLIGVCVIAGNVRRTAQIALGDSSPEYLDLKNYDVNPERAAYGWSSNNSVAASVGQSYDDVAQRIVLNGEPGLFWSHNAQNHARINGKAARKDKAIGLNPCAEQVLESGELCCLVETFPARAESLEDYKRTLKFAYLYAKTVTLTKTHWVESNRVMLRNRRIGCSMTGVAQFISKNGMGELVKWTEEGYQTVQYYDEVYSDWLAVPRSIRTTTVKPSGTVSLLAGATPGIHFPESRYYIRRVRVSKNDPLWKEMEALGYHCEQDVKDASAMVVSFPVDAGEGIRIQDQVSMWEQLSLASLMQRHWSDNAVSVTVTFKPEEAKDVARALDIFQYQLKTVSFLPKAPVLPYPQLPYEAISKEKYEEMAGRIKEGKFNVTGQAQGTVYCDSSSCSIV